MSYTVLPPRTIRQPQGRPTIRWGSDLARGLVLATAGCTYDAVRGIYSTLVNGPPVGPSASVGGDVGVSLTVGSSQRIKFQLLEGMQRPFSVAFIGYLTDRNAAEECAVLKNAADTNYYGILGRGDTGTNSAQAASSGSSFRARISSNSTYGSRVVTVATFQPGPLNVSDPEYCIYVNGVSGTSYSVQSAPINDVATQFFVGSFTGVAAGAFVWNRVLEPDAVKALGADNWQVFARDVRRVYFLGPSASGGGATTGNLSATLGELTATGTAQVAIGAAASATLGALTATGSASIALQATASTTLGTLTATAAATVSIGAGAAITLGALTAAGTVTAGVPPVTLDGAATLGALTATASATIALQATTAATLDALTATGALAVPIQATASGTLGALVAAGTVSVGYVGRSADLAVTLGALTATANATVPVTAASAVTLGAIIAAGDILVPVGASAAATLGALTAAGTVHVGVVNPPAVDQRYVARMGADRRVARGSSPDVVASRGRRVTIK